MAGSSVTKPCRRCKAEDAPYKLRNHPTCRNCYEDNIESKVAKRLGYLHQATRESKAPVPRHYVAGLSFGPSSSSLVHILDSRVRYHASNKSSSPMGVLAVHIDTDLSMTPNGSDSSPAQRLLGRYRARYPSLSFECVHLSRALEVKTVNWSALPVPQGDDATTRLRGMFDSLPSNTSRADVLRLLVRHLLLHIAMKESKMALLLGHTTTALAAVTLAEVANGRGYSVPWQVDDGRFPICTYSDASAGSPSTVLSRTEFPVHFPLRELFKNELNTYIEFTPSLAELLPPAQETKATSVVSHKDISIEEVMARYFDGVEGSFPGIVSNVVRTTGKLDRVQGHGHCGLCGVTLDEQGDSRWAGELGEDESERNHNVQNLCYGCKRTLNG